MMGTNATAEDISKCCLFLAIPSTFGFIFVLLFIWDIYREDLRKKKAMNSMMSGLEKMKLKDSHVLAKDLSQAGDKAGQILEMANEHAEEKNVCQQTMKTWEKKITSVVEEDQEKVDLGKITQMIYKNFSKKESLHEQFKKNVNKKEMNLNED